MENELSIKLNNKISAALTKKFDGSEEEIAKFVQDAVEQKLSDSEDKEKSTSESLKDYLKSGSQGSRAYGVKGQGW